MSGRKGAMRRAAFEAQIMCGHKSCAAMKWCKGVEVEHHTFSVGVLDNVGKLPASYCGRLPAGWPNPME